MTMRPLRTYELLKTFNETAIAQYLYKTAMIALMIKDYATWVKMRRRYNLELVKFMRGL